MFKSFAIFLCAFLLSSCAAITNTPRITTEPLISPSYERVAFSVSDEESLNSLLNWAEDDKPSEAVMSCSISQPLCKIASKQLKKIGVKIIKDNADNDSITLIYSRINARNCSREIFGCATSANTLQMVSDYKQFVSPELSDPQSADKAVRAYEGYVGN